MGQVFQITDDTIFVISRARKAKTYGIGRAFAHLIHFFKTGNKFVQDFLQTVTRCRNCKGFHNFFVVPYGRVFKACATTIEHKNSFFSLLRHLGIFEAANLGLITEKTANNRMISYI